MSLEKPKLEKTSIKFLSRPQSCRSFWRHLKRDKLTKKQLEMSLGGDGANLGDTIYGKAVKVNLYK